MSDKESAAGSVAAVQRSDAAWSAIMTEFGRSGPAQKDFCVRKGLLCKTFGCCLSLQFVRKRLKRGVLPFAARLRHAWRFGPAPG